MKIRLVFLLCLVSGFCRAQIEIRCRNMNWEGSLATAKVSNVIQDRNGYLWFGTLGGLFRYDGYRFKPYRQDGSVQVTKLFTWSDSRLLVQLRGNDYRLFNIHTGRFDTLTVADRQRKKQLLMMPSRADVPDSLHDKCKHLFWDNRRNIVADDGKGNLLWFNRNPNETVRLNVYPQQLISQGNDPYYSVVYDEARQLLWISTNGNGLFVYDRRTRNLQHFGRDTERQTGINTDLFTGLSLDSEGNIWACRDNAPPACITVVPYGVNRLSLVGDTQNEKSREVKMLRSIGDGMLMAGNKNGGNYLTRTDWHPALQSDLNGIDLISACRHPHTGDIILGARRHGVRIGGRWYTHTGNPTSLGYPRVNDIMTDSQGRIWLAVFKGGLDLAEPDANGRYTFRHFFTENSDIQTGRRLVQDANGKIWYGTGAGLFAFKPDSLLADKKNFRYFPLDKKNIVEVHDLLLDSRRKLWVCTHGQGVFVIDTENDSIRHLTTRDGLVFDAAQSAVEDGEGNVWIGTVNGLSCYHAKDGHFSNHHFSATSNGNFFSEAAAVFMDGKVMFGLLDGVLRITPPLTPSKTGGRIAITDVLANGEDRGTTLPHDIGMITFCFSNFSFSPHESVRYTYRLEGYDNSWSMPTNENEITYRHLPPGQYTFRVRLYDSTSTAEATMSITIRPPWWRTWWACIIYLIMAGSAVYLVLHHFHTLNRLRNRIRLERQLTDYKLRFFTNISHEFRTPLTLIQGSMEHLREMEPELPATMKRPLSAMNRSAVRLLRLINQLLEFRKMQNNRLELHLQETDVVEFVHDIFMNFRDAANGKGITLQYLPFARNFVMYIDKNHVDKMVYNLLSNALKYTPAGGSVTVRVHREESRLAISVTDTGVGIPKEKQHELFSRFMQSTFLNDSIGIGLNLTWELARVHHGTVYFEENPQGGSIFTIELPTDKSVYRENEFLVDRKELSTDDDSEIGAWLGDYQEMPPVPMNNYRILVVDDDNDVLQFLKAELLPYFQVETAVDGQEAIELLDASDYDLVISDVRMPRVNGHQLTRHIRQNRRLNHLPVILLTAMADEKQEAKAIGKGADIYLSKPFSPKILVGYCRRLLEKGQAEKTEKAESPKEGTECAKDNRNSPTPNNVITDEQDHRFLEKLNVWIDMHIQEPVVTEDLMAAMGVGRTTLFDKLKQLTGQTPARYVLQLKMERARQMLLQGDMTIKQIAYSLGFNDPHYFSIRFKDLFGMTPKEYAKKENTKR